MTLNVVKQKITECNSLKIQRLKQVGMRGRQFTRNNTSNCKPYCKL